MKKVKRQTKEWRNFLKITYLIKGLISRIYLKKLLKFNNKKYKNGQRIPIQVFPKMI